MLQHCASNDPSLYDELNVVGVDFEKHMSTASSRFGPGQCLPLTTARDWSISHFKKDSIDLVYSFMHFFQMSEQSLPDILSGFERVLRPNGRIVLEYWSAPLLKLHHKTAVDIPPGNIQLRDKLLIEFATKRGFRLNVSHVSDEDQRITFVTLSLPPRNYPPVIVPMRQNYAVDLHSPMSKCEKPPVDVLDAFYLPRVDRGKYALKTWYRRYQKSCKTHSFSSIQNNMLRLSCPVLSERWYGFHRKQINLPYQAPIRLVRTAIVFARCYFPGVGDLVHAHYYFKPIVLPPLNEPKINVVLLQLDAVSRRMAAKQFPQLHKFLHRASIRGAKHVEFMRHSIVGMNSLPNMQRIYCNDECEDEEQNLFAVYKKRGFNVYFSEDYTPQYPNFHLDQWADDRFSDNLFHMYDADMIDMNNADHCIDGGWHNQRFGAMISNTLTRALNGRAGQGLVFSVNALGGHTVNTMLVAQFDEEIARMFTSMESSGQLNHTVFVIFGDHGYHFFNQDDFTQYYEHRNPLLSFLVGADVPQHEAWIKQLTNNRFSLTDQTDLHATLLAMAGQTSPRGYNLLQQQVPLSRTCAQSTIPSAFCPCFRSLS
jgi:SAM-dependent methyltransferase